MKRTSLVLPMVLGFLILLTITAGGQVEAAAPAIPQAIPQVESTTSTLSSLTAITALSKIREDMRHAGIQYKDVWTPLRHEYQNVNVSFTQLSFTEVFYRGNTAERTNTYSYLFSNPYNLKVDRGTPYRIWESFYCVKLPAVIWWGNNSLGYAQEFVNAINSIKYYTSRQAIIDDDPAFASFQELVRAWRSLPVKPAVPEEVIKFKTLGFNAIQNKNFEEAIVYFEQGLKVSPLWVEGQFNVALLYGDLHIYGLAVNHMKRYLELFPNAPDVQTAKEDMIIWEEGANKANALTQPQESPKRKKGFIGDKK